jgi:hypothetical protein
LVTRTRTELNGNRSISASATALGERLDQVEVPARRDLAHTVGDHAVVDRVLDPVRRAASPTSSRTS